MPGVMRTINSFQAKTNCDSRIYEYFLPSYMFMPGNARLDKAPKAVAFTMTTPAAAAESIPTATPTPAAGGKKGRMVDDDETGGEIDEEASVIAARAEEASRPAVELETELV